MNHSEAVAQVVVEAVLHGSRMFYRREQSQSVHDFDLHYADGRVAAVEVTASVDATSEETHAAIFRNRRVRAELCKKAWRVWPETGARISRIRKDVDRYLAAVELAGMEHFFTARDRDEHASVENLYRDLRIVSGEVIEWEAPGYINIAIPVEGSWRDERLVDEAVMLEASKPDNRRKLASAGTAERHLFVFVDVPNHRVWTPLVDSAPPPSVPELPEEITDVWAVGPARSSGHYVVWRASTGSAWYSLGPVTAQLPKSR